MTSLRYKLKKIRQNQHQILKQNAELDAIAYGICEELAYREGHRS